MQNRFSVLYLRVSNFFFIANIMYLTQNLFKHAVAMQCGIAKVPKTLVNLQRSCDSDTIYVFNGTRSWTWLITLCAARVYLLAPATNFSGSPLVNCEWFWVMPAYMLTVANDNLICAYFRHKVCFSPSFVFLVATDPDVSFNRGPQISVSGFSLLDLVSEISPAKLIF
jgi:hypothetical protein